MKTEPVNKFEVKIQRKVADKIETLTVNKFEPLTKEVMDKFKHQYVQNLIKLKIKFEYVLFEYIESPSSKIKFDKIIS